MRKRWLLILSCATLLAFTYSARSIFITVSQGRTIDWVRLIVFEFQYWYVWAVLTPLVLWFARRFELQRTNWRRTLLALIVFGLIIAPFQATVEYSIAFGFDIWRGMSQEEIMRRTFSESFSACAASDSETDCGNDQSETRGAAREHKAA